MATIVINAKNWPDLIGVHVLDLARAVSEVQHIMPDHHRIILGLSAFDIAMVSSQFPDLNLFTQHVDTGKAETSTGKLLPESLKQAGGNGSFLNHSEHPLSLETIELTIDDCRSNELQTCVFTDSWKKGREICRLSHKPDYLAIELDALVGQSLVEHSEQFAALQTMVRGAREVDEQMEIVCAAGIRTPLDARKAFELGFHGVVISSAIRSAHQKEVFLRELLEAFHVQS